MPFQKGHKRWGGRKKGMLSKHGIATSNIKIACQKFGPTIVDELWKIASARTKTGALRYDVDARLRAMQLLLERGYGRPAQEVTMQVKKHIDDFSDEELLIVDAAARAVQDDNAAQDGEMPNGDVPPVDPTKLN